MSWWDDTFNKIGYQPPTEGPPQAGPMVPGNGPPPQAPPSAGMATDPYAGVNWAALPSTSTYTPEMLGKPTAFHAPTAAEMQLDPGYQFRLKQGQDALSHNAAIGGYLRTGGSLKNFNDYAQGQASQEYGNVYNRARDVQGINFSQNLATVGANNQAGQTAWSGNQANALGVGQFGLAAQGQAFTQGLANNQNTWMQNYALASLGQPPK